MNEYLALLPFDLQVTRFLCVVAVMIGACMIGCAIESFVIWFRERFHG